MSRHRHPSPHADAQYPAHGATLHAFDKSAGTLGVDRIDLLILHQALPSRFDLTIDAYRALEKLLADGKVRAIGISNLMPDHLDDLLKNTSVVPAVNQIEMHPYLRQSDVLAADAELAAIDGLDQGVRRGPEPADSTLETFWREIPEA